MAVRRRRSGGKDSMVDCLDEASDAKLMSLEGIARDRFICYEGFVVKTD